VKVDQGNRVGLVVFIFSVMMVVTVRMTVVVAKIRHRQPDVMVDST
jgi:hypothetical protein